MTHPTVSAGLLAGLIDYAISRGAEADTLTVGLNIAPDDLQDPDNRLPFIRYVDLMRRAQRLTGDPALALRWGEHVCMSEVSIVGLIMNASATMGEAFQQLQRFGRLAIEVDDGADGPSFELSHQDGKLFMVHHRAHAHAFQELTENAFARLVCGPRRFLPEPHVLSVHLAYPAPSYRDEYERVFRCPIHFDMAQTAMELHPQIATWRVAQNPRYVFDLLTVRAEELIEELDAKKTVRGLLEKELLRVIHQGNVGTDAMAGRLTMSRQTLFRKLKDEGTSFAVVLEDLRHRLAIQYLKGKNASVNETAYLIGFSEPAAFSRAFKRWTGETPSEFRKNRMAE